MKPKSPWLSAFLWIRENTPKDAVFALDPKYMNEPGVDGHGFRAMAERSVSGRLHERQWRGLALPPACRRMEA